MPILNDDVIISAVRVISARLTAVVTTVVSVVVVVAVIPATRDNGNTAATKHKHPPMVYDCNNNQPNTQTDKHKDKKADQMKPIYIAPPLCNLRQWECELSAIKRLLFFWRSWSWSGSKAGMGERWGREKAPSICDESLNY